MHVREGQAGRQAREEREGGWGADPDRGGDDALEMLLMLLILVSHERRERGE